MAQPAVKVALLRGIVHTSIWKYSPAMCARKKVTLAIEADVYDRAKAALEAGGDRISDYVEDYLRETLPILEAAVAGSTPEEKARAFLAAAGSTFLDQLAELGDAVRTAKERSEGKGGDG
jgi:hypothetical protein